MRVAITGTPGAGKTTLAAALEARWNVPVISAGDVAREIDEGSRATGAMADWPRLAAALAARLVLFDDWILDGLPRSEDQWGWLRGLFPDVRVIHLTVTPATALWRIQNREDGRADSQDPNEIVKRIHEQRYLLGVDDSEGWIWSAAGTGGSVNSESYGIRTIFENVSGYLERKRMTAF